MEKLQIVLTRSIITKEKCQECQGNRMVVFCTEDTEPIVWVVKCIDCGTIAVNSNDKDMKLTLVMLMKILEASGSLKETVDTDLIEYFFKVVSLQK